MQQRKVISRKNSAELHRPHWAILTLLFSFLLWDVLGGAIHYYGAQFHFPWLPYIPHLVVVLCLGPLFFVYLASEGVTPTYLAILVLFGVESIYGLLNLNSASQVEFGIWILTPFLFGIVALPAAIHHWRRLTPYVVVLWVLAVAGVIVNIFYQWPWVGFEYQLGTTPLQASRLWHTAGVNMLRLPGFSTGSYFAAIQILILALFLREVLEIRWWIPSWIVSGAAIAFTTSKAAIAIYIVLSTTWLVCRGPSRRPWRLAPVFLACLDAFLPFSMLLIKVDWLRSIRSPVGTILVASFVDRLQNGWPDWIRMIASHGSVLLGRGLGGIGTPQQYFEPALYSPADNIAIYLYGTFGVLGLAILLFYGWKATRLRIEEPFERFLFFCVCVVLLEGLTADVFGGLFTALAFGASLRYLADGRHCAHAAQPHKVLTRKHPGPERSLNRHAPPTSGLVSPEQG